MSFDYYVFYKPYLVLSQFSSEDNKVCLSDYLSFVKKDVYPIGRLDYDSEGLLLLTNDKRWNKKLLDPDHHVAKEYWVEVEGVPDDEALNKIRIGLDINLKGNIYRTLPAMVCLLKDANVKSLPERNPPIRFRKNIPTTWLSMVIREGKNRQVRKMTAAVGHPTLRLVRYRIGQYTLKAIQPGELIRLKTFVF